MNRRNTKNRIIMSLLTVIFLALNLLLIYLFVDNKNSFFISLGYLLVFFFLYRLLIFLTQKTFVKLKILQYEPDNFSYYGSQKEMREKLNIEYKMQQDRVFSGLLYNIIFIILVSLAVKFLNNEGIISSILVGCLLSIPTFIFMPRLNKLTGYEDFGNPSSYKYNQTPKSRKIKATTWDFGGYRETTYRDEDGNKVGTATSFDWGPVTDTTIEDKDGNKTKIEHWKF